MSQLSVFRSYGPRVLLGLIVFGVLVLISGCDFCLEEMDLCPDELLNSSQWVLTGKLVATDTLACLGTIDYWTLPHRHYVVQYTFADVNLIKGVTPIDTFHLWYLTRLRLHTGYYDGIRFRRGEQALVYGNRIVDETRLVDLLRPCIHSNFVSLEEYLQGTEPAYDGMNVTADSLMYSTIASSTELMESFRFATASGMVIYGTEIAMGTARAYLRGSISFCCSDGQWNSTSLRPSQYVDILIKRVKEMEQ